MVLKHWLRFWCKQLPEDWARTQYNLGFAFEMLGERKAAVAAYQQALQVWRGTNQYYATIAEDNLKRAQAALDSM